MAWSESELTAWYRVNKSMDAAKARKMADVHLFLYGKNKDPKDLKASDFKILKQLIRKR